MQKDAINGRLNDNSFLHIPVFFPDRPLERAIEQWVCGNLAVNLTLGLATVFPSEAAKEHYFSVVPFFSHARAAEFRICTWQPWRVGSTSSTRFEWRYHRHRNSALIRSSPGRAANDAASAPNRIPLIWLTTISMRRRWRVASYR